MEIRDERPADAGAIRKVTGDAFAGAEHASGTEAEIVEVLREEGALLLSLVALEAGEVVGHVAFSPVTVAGTDRGWVGLGPVSVRPGRQGEGIGADLIREGLARLRAGGRAGCLLVGAPGYYGRFGFASDPRLTLAGVPAEYFLALPFGDDVPRGAVVFHAAFDQA